MIARLATCAACDLDVRVSRAPFRAKVLTAGRNETPSSGELALAIVSVTAGIASGTPHAKSDAMRTAKPMTCIASSMTAGMQQDAARREAHGRDGGLHDRDP